MTPLTEPLDIIASAAYFLAATLNQIANDYGYGFLDIWLKFIKN